MKRFLMIMIVLLFAVGLVSLAAPAYADSVATMHLGATGATVGGTTFLIGGGGPYDLSLVSTDGLMVGTAFLGILVPNGGTASVVVSIGSLETSVNFNVMPPVNLGTVLGEPGLTDFRSTALASASAQAGVIATSFTAYDWKLGAYSSHNKEDGLTFTVNTLPIGTVIVAWLEDVPGNAIERTPLSESLTVVPEPGILILLGIAMSAIGAASWRIRKI